MNGHDIKAYIQKNHPEETAFDWDHVGLQVGSLNQKITKIMITLDVTKAVVDQAIKENANFILSHHPLLFNSLQTINLDASKGQLIQKLINHKITVYSAHTNYDISPTGINQVLSDLLGLENSMILEDDLIRPMGRIGTLKTPLELKDFIKLVKETFNLPYALLIGETDRLIQKVAVSGGSGSHHYMAAKKKHADIYLTGDITYHTALEMKEVGILGLDIGHFVESLFKNALKSELEEKWDIPILTSFEQSPYLKV
jgi:dinuclear metal center YbgI/SA1388 family protein